MTAVCMLSIAGAAAADPAGSTGIAPAQAGIQLATVAVLGVALIAVGTLLLFQGRRRENR